MWMHCSSKIVRKFTVRSLSCAGNLAQLQTSHRQADSTLDTNSENIDEILENMRHVSENLREFTEIIKARRRRSFALPLLKNTSRAAMSYTRLNFMRIAKGEVVPMNGLKKLCVWARW